MTYSARVYDPLARMETSKVRFFGVGSAVVVIIRAIVPQTRPKAANLRDQGEDLVVSTVFPC